MEGKSFLGPTGCINGSPAKIKVDGKVGLTGLVGGLKRLERSIETPKDGVPPLGPLPLFALLLPSAAPVPS